MDRPEAIAWPWAFVFPPTADEEEQDGPVFKREDAAAEATADTDPPLRPATCAASDRRVTAAAAAEDMAEQEGNAVAMFVKNSKETRMMNERKFEWSVRHQTESRRTERRKDESYRKGGEA